MLKITFKEMIPVKQGDGKIFECKHVFCKSVLKKQHDTQMFSVQLVDDTLNFFNLYFFGLIQSIEHVKPTDL